MSDTATNALALNDRDNFITRLAETIGGHAGASTVFGEPITRERTTVVPVARAHWGVGGGGGEGSTERDQQGRGFGGGGGMIVKPVGYLVIADSGEVQYRSIEGTLRLLTTAIVGMLLGAFLLRRWR